MAENKITSKFISHIRKHDKVVVFTSFEIFLLDELFRLIPFWLTKKATEMIDNWLPCDGECDDCGQ